MNKHQKYLADAVKYAWPFAHFIGSIETTVNAIQIQSYLFISLGLNNLKKKK